MLKKLVIAVILIIVLIAGLIAYAAMNADSLIAKYKPEIEKAASSSLGAHVTLGELSAHIVPSTEVLVKEFRVARSANAEKGLTLNNLSLKVNPFALLSGRLEIIELSLDEPSLNFLQTSSGLTLEGLPPKKDKPGSSSKTQKTSKDSSQKPAPPTPATLPEGLSLNLNRFTLTNASVQIHNKKDNSVTGINNVNLSASLAIVSNVVQLDNIQFSAGDVQFAGKVISGLGLSLSGSGVSYDLATGNVLVPDLTFAFLGNELRLEADINAQNMTGSAKVRSSGIDLASFSPLGTVAPVINTLKLQGALLPNLEASFSPGSYTAKGTVGAKDVSLVSGGMKISNLGGDIQIDASQAVQAVGSSAIGFNIGSAPAKLQFKAKMKQNQLDLSELLLSAFGGSVKADAGIDLGEAQGLRSNLLISGVQIEPAIAAVKPDLPLTMTGTVKEISANISGKMGANLMQSLVGSARIDIRDGELKGLNLAGRVLKAVTDIPFISGTLYSRVPEEEREELDSENTVIKSLTGDVKIGGGGMNTQNLLLKSTVFDLQGDGRVDFDTTINLNSNILFTKTFSKALVSTTKELGHALDKDERLMIPLTLAGKLANVRVLPNVERLIQMGAKKAVEEKAGELLNKFLGGKKDGSEGRGKDSGLGGLLGF